MAQCFFIGLYDIETGDDFYFFQKNFFDGWKWISKKSIFGKCLNYKSGLRILIGALEVPFFGSQRWALLAKVPVFGPHHQTPTPPIKKKKLEKIKIIPCFYII